MSTLRSPARGSFGGASTAGAGRRRRGTSGSGGGTYLGLGAAGGGAAAFAAAFIALADGATETFAPEGGTPDGELDGTLIGGDAAPEPACTDEAARSGTTAAYSPSATARSPARSGCK